MPQNSYVKYENALSLAMVEEALVNESIKSVLVDIARRLQRDVLSKIRSALSENPSNFSPELQSVFNSLAMQHSVGDKFVGALLPDCTQEYLQFQPQGRQLLIDAIDRCLNNADQIHTPAQFLSLMKVFDGMAFAFGSNFFNGLRTDPDYELIKLCIAPTPEEVGIRSPIFRILMLLKKDCLMVILVDIVNFCIRVILTM